MKLDLLPKVCYDNSIPHRTGATEMKRIMIIEDEPALRDELSVLLQNAGYEPIAVTDYDNVSEQMKVADADLILLDINLPNVNGETLLQDFRKEHDTPVIMLTSRTTEIDEVLSMSYGADRLYHKALQSDYSASAYLSGTETLGKGRCGTETS